MKTFCENCRKDVTYSLKEKEANGFFKGRRIKYKIKVANCNDCRHRVYVPSINDDNLKAFYTKYFKEYPEEEFKDMTREELLGELGWYKKLYKELIKSIDNC